MARHGLVNVQDIFRFSATNLTFDQIEFRLNLKTNNNNNYMVYDQEQTKKGRREPNIVWLVFSCKSLCIPTSHFFIRFGNEPTKPATIDRDGRPSKMQTYVKRKIPKIFVCTSMLAQKLYFAIN